MAFLVGGFGLRLAVAVERTMYVVDRHVCSNGEIVSQPQTETVAPKE